MLILRPSMRRRYMWAGGGHAVSGDGADAGVAPVLDWDDEEDDSTPDFTVDFDEASVVEGNIIDGEIYSDAGLTTLVATFTNGPTGLSAGDIVAGIISIAADALSNGTYYVRSKITGSDWSNTETVTIDAGTGEPIGLLLALTKA